MLARTVSWGVVLGLSALVSLCVSPLSAAQAAYPTWMPYAGQVKTPLFRPWSRADAGTWSDRRPTPRMNPVAGQNRGATGRRMSPTRWDQRSGQAVFAPDRAGARKAVPVTRGQELGLRFRPDERESPYDRGAVGTPGAQPNTELQRLHSQFRPARAKRKPSYEELQAGELADQQMPRPMPPYSAMPPPMPGYGGPWPRW